MVAITPYTIDSFGIELPAACIEVKEVNVQKDKIYYAGNDETGAPIYRNTIVRFKVWANQAAYDSNKQPIAEGERFVDFAENEIMNTHNSALNIAFPEGIIQ